MYQGRTKSQAARKPREEGPRTGSRLEPFVVNSNISVHGLLPEEGKAQSLPEVGSAARPPTGPHLSAQKASNPSHHETVQQNVGV